MSNNTISLVEATKLPGNGPFMVDAVEKEGHKITAITFNFPTGELAFRVRYQDYSVKVHVPAPPKLVKKTKVSATNETLKVTLPDEFFDSDWDAANRKRDLENAGFTVTKEEVEVPEAE
jgi:hypothetical protein